jgi:hypothetical protein
MRQFLAQLDTPLVKQITSPDNVLGKNAVLVKSDELAEGFRYEPLDEYVVRRTKSWRSRGCNGREQTATATIP